MTLCLQSWLGDKQGTTHHLPSGQARVLQLLILHPAPCTHFQGFQPGLVDMRICVLKLGDPTQTLGLCMQLPELLPAHLLTYQCLHPHTTDANSFYYR